MLNQVVALGTLVRIRGGKRLPAGRDLQQVPNSHPYIRVRDVGSRLLPSEGLEYVPDDIFPSIARYIVETNDVVISIVGTIGALSFIDARYHKASLTENCAKLTGLDKLDSLYLYYYLSSSFGQEEIRKGTVGAVQPKLPLYNISNIQVRWPIEKSERAHVASLLASLDDKIELNRKINQTLEQMAPALFQAWFVDFEPVKAKVAALADGRDPLRAAMSTLSGKTDAELDELPSAAFDALATTAALFPEEMEESAEIPKGWEISDIGQEVAVLGGGTPSTSNADYWNGEFAWVTPKDLSRLADKVLTMTERRITKAGVQNISSGQLPIGTVLLSSRAPIGYLALTTIPVSINQGFIAMVCSRRLPNMYVLQWATQNLDAIKQRGSGTTFAEISKGNFRPMPILVPDEKALSAYQEFTLPLYEQITTNLRETDTLATLRDSLLPKLLSGELAATPEEQGPERRGIEKGVREGRGIERTWD